MHRDAPLRSPFRTASLGELSLANDLQLCSFRTAPGHAQGCLQTLTEQGPNHFCPRQVMSNGQALLQSVPFGWQRLRQSASQWDGSLCPILLPFLFFFHRCFSSGAFCPPSTSGVRNYLPNQLNESLLKRVRAMSGPQQHDCMRSD